MNLSGARKTLRIAIIAVSLLAGLSLAACAPSPAPTEPPATPSAIIETAVPELEDTQPPPAVSLVPHTPPARSLEETARQVHGERLISLINIPSLSIYTYVTPVGWELDVTQAEDSAWDSPGALVGWAVSSALPGDDGNILLYGHNNIYTSVFRDLYQLQPGDEIGLTTGEREWRYRVAEVVLLPEAQEDADSMLVEYMKPTRAPRLTIISCYPPDNNTHRVIVIARPVDG